MRMTKENWLYLHEHDNATALINNLINKYRYAQADPVILKQKKTEYLEKIKRIDDLLKRNTAKEEELNKILKKEAIKTQKIVDAGLLDPKIRLEYIKKELCPMLKDKYHFDKSPEELYDLFVHWPREDLKNG